MALGQTSNPENCHLAEKCFDLFQRFHGAEMPFSKKAWGDTRILSARSRWLLVMNRPGVELLRLHMGDCLTHMRDDADGRYDVFCDMMTILPPGVSKCLRV